MSVRAEGATQEQPFRAAVLEHLAAIRSALDRLCAPPADGLEQEDAYVCAHPVDRRIDMGGMGVEDWTCRDCGHRERYSTRKGADHAIR